MVLRDIGTHLPIAYCLVVLLGWYSSEYWNILGDHCSCVIRVGKGTGWISVFLVRIVNMINAHTLWLCSLTSETEEMK